MEIKIVLANREAKVPTRSDDRAIGYDLYVSKDTVIRPGTRTIVPTGVIIDLPLGVEGKIEPRSGMSAKGMTGIGLPVFNAIKPELHSNYFVRYDADVIPGKIDPGYVEPIGIIVKSYDSAPFVILAGTRLAQITFYKVEHPTLRLADEIKTESRGGGFNSSGVR